MPKRGGGVNSVVAGQPGEDRRPELKRKTGSITRSYSNFCHAEIWQQLPSRSSKNPQDYHKRSTSTHVTQVLGTRLGLSASIGQATTRSQVMARL